MFNIDAKAKAKAEIEKHNFPLSGT